MSPVMVEAGDMDCCKELAYQESGRVDYAVNEAVNEAIRATALSE
jgi:hypothetical protein